jgi:hypothetical protein
MYSPIFITCILNKQSMKGTKNLLHLLLMTFLFISSSSKAQNETGKQFSYKIDSTISYKIEKMKFAFEDGAVLDTELMINDKESNMPLLSGKSTPCYAMMLKEKDTIRVLLLPMWSPGHGAVIINLYNDTAVAFHDTSPRDGEKRFKRSLSDTTYESYAHAQAIKCNIILAGKPQWGKPIQGYIEFEGESFYTKDDGKQSYNAKGYFKTSIMAGK